MTLSRWNENKKKKKNCKLGPADEKAAWGCVHMEIKPQIQIDTHPLQKKKKKERATTTSLNDKK